MIDQTTCATCGGRRALQLWAGCHPDVVFHHARGDCGNCAGKKAEAARVVCEQARERRRRREQERAQHQEREREEEARASVCVECNGPRDPQMRFRVGDKGLCDRCNRQRKEQERREKLWRGLQERIGSELQKLDPEHPDFDRAAYEKAQLWDGFKYFDAHGKRCFPTEEEKEKGGWEPDGVVSLYVYGPAGCGKTRIAVFICRRECANFEFVEFITETQFVAAVAAMANTDTREASAELFARLSEADLLFFDDLGTASLTEARYSRLFELVDYRYREGLPTVWTSNKSPAQIREWVKRYWIKQGCDEEEARTNAHKVERRITGTISELIAEIIECE